jgi:hypothetical protein
MKNPFRKKQQNNDSSNEEEKEFSFIWYKEMEAGGKKFYTQPFRTKIKAKTFACAKEKMITFALGKMKLVIVPEDDFKKTDLAQHESTINNLFGEFNKIMESVFGGVKLKK